MGNNWERIAIEMTYHDHCDVYHLKEVEDNHMTRQKKERLYKDVPCALSQKTIRPSSQTESVNNVTFEQKLFLSPAYNMKAGYQIEVSREGMSYSFESVGEPFVYPTHQEVPLSLLKRA